MRFGITVSFATLAVVLATSQQADDNAAHNSLVTRESKPSAGGAPSGPDAKLQGDPKLCAAIIKMIEGNKSSGASAGAPPASSPKTRRGLREAGSHYLTRRAPPAGDSKGGAGAAPADSCKKLQDMAKKGAPSGGSPKPKTGSGTPSPQTKPPKTGSAATPDTSASSTPAATPDATPATAPTRRDLSARQTQSKPPAGGAPSGPDAKLQGDPKLCAAIIKMIDGNKSGGASAGAPPASSPKTRRSLREAGSHYLTRRAPPAGDSKGSTGAAPADSCKKLQDMAKKGAPSGGSPKPKTGSATSSPQTKPPKTGSAATPDASSSLATASDGVPPEPKVGSGSKTPAASPDASPAAAPARRDLNHNAEHNSLSTRENKPAGGATGAAGAAGAAPEGKPQGDPKACAAILKMIEALKSGGASASGPPGASPKTRRELSGADNDRMIRRAAPAGDSKANAGAAPADSCKKLQEMAKKAMQGAGSKPKSGSASPPAASPEAKPKGGAAATPDASPEAKPKGGAAATPDASPEAKPKGGAGATPDATATPPASSDASSTA